MQIAYYFINNNDVYFNVKLFSYKFNNVYLAISFNIFYFKNIYSYASVSPIHLNFCIILNKKFNP